MKNILFLSLMLLAGAHIYAQQKTDQDPLLIERNVIDKTPSTISIHDGSSVQKEGVAEIFHKYFGIDGTTNKATLANSTTTKQHTVIERYEQYCKGIKVENAAFTVLYGKDGYVRFMNGNFYNVPTSGIAPKLGVATARNKALNSVKATSYAWQIPGLENHLKLELNDPAATYYPTGELVWIEDYTLTQKDRKLHLAYKFNVYAIEPLSREHIYVDAITGKILQRNSLIDNISGSGPSLYSGTVNFKTSILGGINKLRDSTRGGGINTYTCGNTIGTTISDITSATASWAGDAALDAHWGAEKVYDYWFIEQGRNSYNNSGAPINSYTHYSVSYNNAFWNGSQMTYGDGSGLPGGFSPLTAIDVCGHEIGHAVCQYTAGLLYNGESGAMNEGFSDIWGAIIEEYADPHETDAMAKSMWKIGEEIGTNPIRRMDDPNLRYQPDTYGGTYWMTVTGCTPSATNDYCGVHTNSGVLNYWFYLLCHGGSGTNDISNVFSVTGIGNAKGADIAYQTELLLTSTSNFANCRTASISAASTLYGPCSPEVEAVTRAWYAVGVGANYSGGSVSAVTGISGICSGATTALTTVSTGGTWASSTPLVGTVSTTGVVTGLSTGTTNISYLVAGSCYAMLTVTVSTPATVSAIAGPLTVCEFATATLSNTTSGGSWTSSDLSVATIGVSSGDISGVSVGTVNITYTFTNSCSSAITSATRTVNPSPAAISGTVNVCMGNTTTLSSATPGGTWISSTPAVATVGLTTGIVSAVAAGTAAITYAIGLCYTIATVTVVPPLTGFAEAWTIKAAMPAVLSTCAAAAIDSIIYVAGGNSGSGPVNTLYAYNVNTNSWSTKAPMSVARGEHFAEAVNGKLYVFGGFNGSALNSVEEYNPATNTWATKAPMPTSRGQFSGTVIGTKVYICGGWIGSYTQLEVYDVPTNTWSTVAPMHHGKIQKGGGAALGGKFYFIGGKNYTNSAFYDSVLVYNPVSNSWSVSLNMPYQRFGCTAAVIGSRVYVMGGATGGSYQPNYSNNNYYDQATGTWTSALGLIGSRASGAAVTVNGKIYLIGGISASSSVNWNHEYTPGSPSSITGVLTVCEGNTTSLTASSPTGVWTSGTPSVATIGATSGIVTGISTGTTMISYAVGTGCFTTAIVTVNVSPTPITGDHNVCLANTTTLASTPSGGTWSSSTPLVATVGSATGVVTGINIGTSVITYAIGSCYTTAVVTVMDVRDSSFSFSRTDSTRVSILPASGHSRREFYDTAVGFTWEAWVYLKDTNYEQVSFIAVEDSVSCQDIRLGIGWNGPTTKSHLNFLLSNGTSCGLHWTYGDTPITPLKWHHVAVVCDYVVEIVYLYLDGALIGTGTFSSFPSPALRLRRDVYTCLGNFNSTKAQSFNGYLDEVKFWRGPRTHAQVIADTTSCITYPEPNLVAYFKAKEGSGTYTASSVNSDFSGVNNAHWGPQAPIDCGGFTINGSLLICVGNTSVLTVSPTGGVWSSSNTAIATIGSASGIATGVAAGTATISYAVASGCFTTAVVTVNMIPAAITGTLTVGVGSTFGLSDTPPGGTWSSSNIIVATIGSGTGTVSALAIGTTIISYRLSTGCAASAVLTVGCTTTGAGIISTILGTGVSGNSPGGLPGTSTALSTPWGITADAAGNVYVCDFSNNKIRMVDPSGYATIFAGTGAGAFFGDGGPAASAGISQPTGMSINGSDIFLVDLGANRVRKINSSGVISSVAGGGVSPADGIPALSANIGGPNGLFVDAAGVIYIPEQGPRRARKVNTSGIISNIAGDGTYGSGGDGGPAVSAQFMLPNEAVADAFGNVFIADFNNNKIRKVDAATGIISTYAGTGSPGFSGDGGPASIAAIRGPGGMTFDIFGNLLICDVDNHRIRKIDHVTGIITTIAGIGTAGHSGDGGNADLAQLNRPHRIYCDALGRIYISEAGSRYVRKIMPAAAAISGTMSICVSQTTTLSATPSGGVWSSSDPSKATIGSSTGIVTSVAAGTTTIVYTPVYACPASVIFTVNPAPATLTGPSTICVGNTDFISTATTGGTWSSSDPSVATVGPFGVVNGITTGTVTISYITSAGCPATHAMTVVPLGAIGVPAAICIGGTTLLTASPAGGTWSISDITVATISIGGLVAGVSIGTATVTYSLGFSCFTTRVVTVNAVTTPITGSLAMCVSGVTTLGSSPPGGIWASDNISVASIAPATGTLTAVGVGTARVTYAVAGGCRSVAVVTVTATTSPITGPSNVCVGDTATLANVLTGGTWSAASPNVAVGSSSGVVTGISSGSAIITYSLSAGCYTTTIMTVNATPAPITGPGSGCSGNSIVLANTTPGGAWSSGDPSIATVASTGTTTLLPATPMAAGSGLVTNVVISYTVGGCTVNKTVTVLPTPVLTGTAAVCVAATTMITSGTGSFIWTFGAPEISVSILSGSAGNNTAIVTGVAAGTATISVARSGCGTLMQVTVNALPAAITGQPLVCVGATSTLSSATTGGTWSSSNAAVTNVGSTTGIITGVSAGTAIIVYTNAAGCTRSVVATVNPAQLANTGITTICIGQTTTLSNATSGSTWSSSNTSVATVGAATGIVSGIGAGTANISYGSAGCLSLSIVTVNAATATISGMMNVCVGATTALSYPVSGGTWSSGNSAIATVATDGTVTGAGAGTATISYIPPTGCPATTIVTVNLSPATISGATFVCEGATTPLTNSTVGGTWTSSNTTVGTISAAGVVTGVLAGTTLISYATGSGCFTTMQMTVNSAPGPIMGSLFLCITNTTLFTSSPSGGAWSSSNTAVATVGTDGAVTGAGTGTANISYTLSSGCAAVATVTVGPVPPPIVGAQVVCVSGATTLTNTGGGTWSSSNTVVASVSGGGVVTGLLAGTTRVTYMIGAGCFTTMQMTVNPLPEPVTGVLFMCNGNTTTLSSSPIGGTWSSSSTSVATIGTDGAVTSSGIGTANISYSLSTGCAASATVTVGLVPAAISGTLAVCQGSTTLLSNTTTGGTWASANTVIATVSASGNVIGVSPGLVNITYSLSTGCMVKAEVTVNALPVVAPATTFVCEGNAITWAGSPSGGTWASSNTTIAQVGTGGTITGITAGTANITYTISNGCRVSALITVGALPANIGGSLTICAGGASALTSAPSGGTWISGNASVATVDITSGNVIGIVPGTASISYTSSQGCARAVIATVTPVLTANVGANILCVAQSSTFTNTTAGGTWSTSNAAVASISSATGLASGVSPGTAIITYATSGSCRSLTQVTVYSMPAITGNTNICTGVNTTLAHAFSGGTWSSSFTYAATVDPGTGVVTGQNAGTAIISYVKGGCFSTVVMSITSAPAPIAGPTQFCLGSLATFTNLVGSGTWTSSNPSVATVSTVGILTAVSVGVTDVIYATGTGTGCQTSTPVAVLPLPSPIAGPSYICSGSTATFTSSPYGGTWGSSNTGFATAGAGGTVTAVAAGTTYIQYTLPTGCITSVIVTVGMTPSVNGTLDVCSGNTTILLSPSPGGTWSSGNLAVATIGSASGLVTGITAGTSEVTYTNLMGCWGITTVTVAPALAPNTGTPVACVGQTTTLANIQPGGTWASGNPGIASVVPATGIVTGVNAGTSRITYMLTGTCWNFTQVTINALTPIVSATWVCAGTVTTLTNGVSGGTWSSTNPAVATIGSTTGVVTGIAAGTTVVSYTVAGCYKTVVITVTSAPAPVTGTSNACVGSFTTLVSATPGGSWSSNNVLTATIGSLTGVVTGINAGTSIITYVAGGCYQTFVVTVNNLPAAIAGSYLLCAGNTSLLSPLTPGGTWNSGDITIATVGAGTGVVTGVTSGTAVISYTNASGCTRPIVVTVSPAIATTMGDAGVCVGYTTTLSNATPGGTWSSSDVMVAAVTTATGVVTGLSPGTANIYYSTTGNCFATREVTINSLAAITGPTRLCAGNTVTLLNPVSGGIWSSSDTAVAGISTGSGLLSGKTAGTAIITYVASGCARTTIVTVDGLPATIANPPAVCVGSTITLVNSSGGGTWMSGNTGVATIDIFGGKATGISAGSTEITFTLSTGCSTRATLSVIDVPAPIEGNTTLCYGSSSTLVSASPGSNAWTSSNTHVATIDNATGKLEGVAVGSSTITYRGSNGCYTTAIVRVIPLPALISGNLKICEGTTTNLTSPGTTGGTWISASEQIATIGNTDGIVTGKGGGTSAITYIWTNTCLQTAVVTVRPLPPVDSIVGRDTLMVGSNQTLTSGYPGGMWRSDQLAVAKISASTGLMTGVAPGAVTITYTLSNGCGFTNATRMFEILERNIKFAIYPDPTKGPLTIESPLPGVLTIYTIDGKLVTHHKIVETTTSITLPYDLARGVYMCTFTTRDGNRVVMKLVYE